MISSLTVCWFSMNIQQEKLNDLDNVPIDHWSVNL
jgi:hypothetical protein